MRSFWIAFVPLFVAVDPIAVVPLFVGLCGEMEEGTRRRVIVQSVTTALVVAIGFIFIGKLLLQMLGVTEPDFLVAGGALLFVIALSDLVSPDKRRMALDATIGAVPLGVPLIVGPAVLTTSLLLRDSPQVGVLMTSLAVAANILLTGLALLWSRTLLGWLGAAGTRVLSKLASLILAALAVMFMRRGVEGIIALLQVR